MGSFFNVVFAVFYALIIIACVMDGYLAAAIICLLMILGNCMVIYFATRSAKSTKYWLSESEGTITIRYPNVWHNMEPLTLNIDQIVKIECYRLFSVAGLLALTSYTLPQAVYITFWQDGKEECRCIGHPDHDEISELCRKHEIPVEFR